MKLLGISGTLAGHKTAKIVCEVLDTAEKEFPDLEIELLDLKDYDIEFMQGFPLSYYNDDTQKAVNKIRKADCIVIGTPIYQASISGSLKNLLDLLPERAFKGKAVGYISTAGSEKHFMIAEFNLEPIIHFLGGIVPPVNVFVPNASFDEENEIADKDIMRRISGFAKDLVGLANKLSK